ncbi:MAG: PAS domain-containing protein [Phycisphaerales bacterium]
MSRDTRRQARGAVTPQRAGEDPLVDRDAEFERSLEPSRSRFDRAAPWVVLAFAIIASAAVALEIKRRSDARNELEFEHRAAERVERFQRAVQDSLDALQPVRLLFAASDRVERVEFEQFASGTLSQQPSLLAVAWIPRITDAERPAFERSIQNPAYRGAGVLQEGPGGYVRADQRDDYFPIEYIEPAAARRLIGTDLGQRRLPVHALMRAFDRGDLALSIPAVFEQVVPTPCVLAFLGHIQGTTFAGPHQGVVMGMFDLDALVRQAGRGGTHEPSGPSILLRVRDAERTDILAQSADPAPREVGKPVLSSTRQLLFGGRRWIVIAESPASAWKSSSVLPIGVLACGTLAGGLCSMFMSGRISRRRAHQHVVRLTRNLRSANRSLHENERRLRSLFDAAIDPLWDWDVATDTSKHSLSWLHLVGLEPGAVHPDEVVWSSRLHPDDAPRVWQALQRCVSGETGFYEAQYRLRHETKGWIEVNSRGCAVSRDPRGRATRMVGNVTDVSGLLSAQRAVAQSEEQFRQLAANIDSVFWMMSFHDRQLFYISPAFTKIWGRSPADFLEPRIDWKDTIHPDDRATATAAFQAWIDRGGEGVFDVVYRIVRPDAQVRWIRDRGFPVRDSTGSVYRLAGFAEDVTDRMHSESALAQSEQRYRVLFHRMPEPVMVLQDDRIIMGNHAAALLLGLDSPDSLAGASLFDRILGADREMSRRLADSALADGAPIPPWRVEIDHPAGVRTVEIAASRIPFGDRFALLTVARDLTDQIRAAELLSEARDRLYYVLGRLPDIVAYDTSEDRPFVSENFLKLVGHDAADLTLVPDVVRSFIHPDDRDFVLQHARDLRASRPGSSKTLQFRLRRADGSDVWIENRMVLVPTIGGGSRVVGVLIDFTQLKRAEFALRAAMAERDHRVKNNLASVIAIANHMFRDAGSLPEYHAQLVARIRALSNVHHSLAQNQWLNCEISAIVADTLEPFLGSAASPTRVALSGPVVPLPARYGPPLALTLHELATNAAKHGALSTPQGQVRVNWVLDASNQLPTLRLVWVESGGPLVHEPTRRGFGRAMIQDGLQHDLGASVALDFRSGGLVCRIDIPVVQTDSSDPVMVPASTARKPGSSTSAPTPAPHDGHAHPATRSVQGLRSADQHL